MNSKVTPGPWEWRYTHDYQVYSTDEKGRRITTDLIHDTPVDLSLESGASVYLAGPVGSAGCKGRFSDLPEFIVTAEECPKAANARIIAEAGTVASETGLTPRELMEQRDGLLLACETAIVHIEPEETAHGRTFAAGRECRAALKKAKVNENG